MEMTQATNSLFNFLCKDSFNWNGMPLFQGSKEERGNLTDLKKRGLVTTEQDDENRACYWVIFTDAGREYAKQNNVEVCEHK